MKVTVKGTVYAVDSEFTGWEWRLIKQVAGIRVLEYEAALLAGDYDLMVAIALVAMRRHGVEATEGDLLDEPGGVILIDLEDPEELDPTEPSPPRRRGRAKNPTGGDPGDQ